MSWIPGLYTTARAKEDKTMKLKSYIGCSSCSIRSICDDQENRRDLTIEESITYGLRGGVICIKLHKAYRPEDLSDE